MPISQKRKLLHTDLQENKELRSSLGQGTLKIEPNSAQSKAAWERLGGKIGGPSYSPYSYNLPLVTSIGTVSRFNTYYQGVSQLE
ncbi:hypothetical protein IFM47457_08752 [Aspergillus lentulus]|nr:hypothetical protein IFM47457_08752 [Aspergillus lentulus]